MADLYVSTTGSDSNAGTKDAPFKTITKASQIATAGTTVHVAPGTYKGHIVTNKSGTESAPIEYVSDVKWGAKIIPAATSGSNIAWENNGDHVRINGFEIDGSGFQGGTPWRFGIYTTGTGSVVLNNKVHDVNRDQYALSDGNGGAGIEGDGYNGDTNISIIGNEVYNIGPSVGSSSLIQGIYLTTDGAIQNNLIHNIAAGGISLWHDPHHVQVTHNTIFATDVGILVGAGDFVNNEAPNDYTNVSNNIVYDNASVGILESGYTGTHNTYTNNLVYKNGQNWSLQNGNTHTGTIAADPKFVNYVKSGGGDYHLASGSPAIDSGSTTRTTTSDLDGVTRSGQGARPDIGAYEYKVATNPPQPEPTPTPTPEPTPTPTPEPTPVAGGTTIVVNASGTPAGGVNAHFNLLVDGKKVGEGIAGTTAKDFTFKTSVTADQAHKVQVQFDNDAHINGQDRNLTVNKITINGKAVDPTASIVSYDKGALDGKDVAKGQPNMWWDGTLVVNAGKAYFPAGSDAPVPTPGTAAATVVVNALGTPAGGVNAHFNLLVDGKKVGEGITGTTAKDFAFNTSVTADQAHKVQVQFDNDAHINGQDRNLIVNKITINGKAILPTASNVTYDKGALDGKDVAPGQSGMWWDGTLVVNAGKALFPATATATAQSLDADASLWAHVATQQQAADVTAVTAHAVETPVTTGIETLAGYAHDHLDTDMLHTAV